MKKYIGALLCALAISNAAYASEAPDPYMQAVWNTAKYGATMGGIGSVVPSLYVVYALWNSKLPWQQKLKLGLTIKTMSIVLGGGFALLIPPLLTKLEIIPTADYEKYEIPSAIVGGALGTWGGLYYGNAYFGDPLHLNNAHND